MFERELEGLGFTQEQIKGAIRKVIDSSPVVKETLEAILGEQASSKQNAVTLKRVGEVGGETLYVVQAV
jgi:hypothetical protein